PPPVPYTTLFRSLCGRRRQGSARLCLAPQRPCSLPGRGGALPRSAAALARLPFRARRWWPRGSGTGIAPDWLLPREAHLSSSGAPLALCPSAAGTALLGFVRARHFGVKPLFSSIRPNFASQQCGRGRFPLDLPCPCGTGRAAGHPLVGTREGGLRAIPKALGHRVDRQPLLLQPLGRKAHA